ncbi:MAG TPA: HIT domain-containing protein, partial [Armatimonadota bacterium]|nr:HIT domain-containing protein [Armatimonadota bacterium]
AFCRPGIGSEALWESHHYRVLADGYPRCAGHVLLVTKEHLPSHMQAAEEWLEEFERAQDLVRRFLEETFGGAAFYENGGARQEVPHAHLHGLPFEPLVPQKWLKAGRLERIGGWSDAREECRRSGHYFYLEAGEDRFLVRDYGYILSRVRGQLVDQTEARLDPRTGRMVRGGPEMVQRTAALWRRWSAATNPG